MGRWCLGNHMTPQCVCDVAIVITQSCDEKHGSFTQDPGRSGPFTQYPGGRKIWIVHLENLI